MKKIGILSINPEKVIKNEELVNLKGGYGDATACCLCKDDNTQLGYIVGITQFECDPECWEFYGSYAKGFWVC